MRGKDLSRRKGSIPLEALTLSKVRISVLLYTVYMVIATFCNKDDLCLVQQNTPLNFARVDSE
jgi:hypothetical protein